MIRVIAIAAAGMFAAGCASFSADGGFDRVSELTRERTGQPLAAQRTPADQQAATARVAELMGAPLTPAAAVEVALLNNRGLRASLAELGIAEADRVRAGRLRNPSFSFGRLSGGGDAEIERAVLFDVLGLLALPVTAEVGRERFAQAQLQAADDAVRLAAEVRRAYFDAVAAQELAAYFQQVQEAADVSSELARRMLRAGNFSKLEQMRQQAFHADAVAQLARARHQTAAQREKLVRLLGLDAEQAGLRLPERLPELPRQAAEPRDAERTALEKRLDVQMARLSAAATARSLGLTRATRLVNVLEVGYQNKSESGRPRSNGFEVELELPLFDFGATRAARAEAVYMQAVHRAAEVAVHARSEVREAHAAYRTAYELARHYRDEVVPLRKRMSEENLLRYNGMLISVFDLLADAREQIAGVTGYVQALRDFWIAETQLQTALTGRSPGAASLSPPAATGGSTAPEAH